MTKCFSRFFLAVWFTAFVVNSLQVTPQKGGLLKPQEMLKQATAFCVAGACLFGVSAPAGAASDIVYGSLEKAIIGASDATYPVLKSLTAETVSPLANKVANLVTTKMNPAKLTTAIESGVNALLSIPDEKLDKFTATVKESYEGVSGDSCNSIPLPIDAINSLTPPATSSLDAAKLEQVTKKFASTAQAIPSTSSSGICLPSSKEGLEKLWIGQTELVIGIPKASKQELVAKAGAAVKSIPNPDLLRVLPDMKKVLKGVDPKTAKKFETTGQTLDKVLKNDVRFRSLAL